MPHPWIPDRFEVLEELWQSDAEIALRARDRTLLREVVLKLARPGVYAGADRRDVARSLREARTLARVHHPGVMRLLDVMETPGGPMLVIEPVVGETLADRFERGGPLAPAEIRTLGIRLCDALEAVHSVGVVHRGVSAENIVLRADGTPCLAGFVFAKFGANTHSTMPGTTFVYPANRGAAERTLLPPLPAPEQVQGQVADARSDVFGLGWVLYESLTGAPPFPQDLDVEQWRAPTDAHRLRPDVPRELSDVLSKCLNPSPLKRFPNAASVRSALEAAAAATAGAGTRERPPLTRGAQAARMAGAVAIVCAIGGAFSIWSRTRETSAELSTSRGGERGVAVHAGPPASYAPEYSASHALLIGIGEGYEATGLPPLWNAERDVSAISKKLGEMPWERWDVKTLVGADATRQGILDALSLLAESVGRDDRVFVYYAGHGEASSRAERRGWIIPFGAKSVESDPGRASWVPFDDFFHFFEEAPSKHILMAMDCCYGGRLAQSRSLGAEVFNAKFLSEQAHVVIASGRPNERVSDGVAGESSPFARAFLGALSIEGVHALTSSGLFVEIQRVFASYPGQTPQLARPESSPPGGEIVFFLEP